MKVAFVTIFNPQDIHAWSGTGTYMLAAIQRAGLPIETIGNLKYRHDFIYKTKELLYSNILQKKYRVLWDPILLKNFADQVSSRLAVLDHDVVFSVWPNPIAYLQTKKPIVYWGDATLAGLMEMYPSYQNMCAETIRDGHKAERLALANCRLAIYSSEWAANTAMQYYQADPNKVKVVPLGANIVCNRSKESVLQNLQEKDNETCKLLFVGVEWFRKGGDIALQAAAMLHHRGIPVELHIVGCNPPDEVPEFVKLHGYITKTTKQGRELIDDLYTKAHFLIVPTRAEAYGVVFAEASSFGLPSLATDVGGVSTVIRNGRNGLIFPLEAGPDAYSDAIENLWLDRKSYEQMALSAFQEYEERLNWEAAGRKVSELLYEFCG